MHPQDRLTSLQTSKALNNWGVPRIAEYGWVIQDGFWVIDENPHMYQDHYSAFTPEELDLYMPEEIVRDDTITVYNAVRNEGNAQWQCSFNTIPDNQPHFSRRDTSKAEAMGDLLWCILVRRDSPYRGTDQNRAKMHSKTFGIARIPSYAQIWGILK